MADAKRYLLVPRIEAVYVEKIGFVSTHSSESKMAELIELVNLENGEC